MRSDRRALASTICILQFALLASGPAWAQDAPGAVQVFDRTVLRQMTRRADSLLYARRFAAAESAYADLLEADSNYAPGYLGIATARFYGSRGRGDKAVRVLRDFQKAVELAPGNPIAQLRYGEALLPWRVGGREPDSARIAQAIEHLVRALELAPNRVEPYQALCLARLARGERTQAEAGLRELTAHDFFPKPVLDFGYNLLVSADSNGLVFVNGDMDLFPALALQADGLRSDVTIVSIPLLDAPWYVKYLKHARNLPVSFGDDELETLAGRYDKGLERTLTPGERVLQDVVGSRHRVKGGFYFAITVRRPVLEIFKRNLSLEGYVYRVSDDKDVIPVNEKQSSANLGERYRGLDFQGMPVWRTNSSPLTRDYSALAKDCAAAYWALADEYRSRGEISRASSCCRKACTILVSAGKWVALEKVLKYWLKVAPQDPDALRLKKDFYGE
jgi:tetratricopeptide (TPR) repeat protein